MIAQDTVNQTPTTIQTPPTITKRQRNNTTNTPAAPAYQTNDISYTSGDQVEFEITVNNPNTTDLVGNYTIFDSTYSE